MHRRAGRARGLGHPLFRPLLAAALLASALAGSALALSEPDTRAFGLPHDAALTTGGRASFRSGPVEFDPSLEAVLAESAPTDKIPVLIFLREQGLQEPDLRRARSLSLPNRRRDVRSKLTSLAANTQTDLLAELARLEAQGEAENVRSLWLVNGVAAEINAEHVYDLLLFDEIRKVQWDPEIPLSEMADETSSPFAGGGISSAMPAPVNSWSVTRVRAPECWNVGFNGTGVVVAIIDTGVDYNHPDLSNHIWVNPNEIPNDFLDNDQNGKIDDWRGWDFVDNDNDPMDSGSDGHGTHVAGIVVGDGTGGTRYGVAPGAKIMIVRASGDGNWSKVFEGLGYAVTMNCDVIQMSQSQKWRFDPKPDFAAWRALCDNELALGYFHANSIGNEGDNQNTDPIPFNISAPGNCPSPWMSSYQYLVGSPSSVVGVGAIGPRNYAADQSSRGPADWEDFQTYYPQYPWATPQSYRDYPYSLGLGGLLKPDLVAPGDSTFSTNRFGTGYGAFNGTSAATPHVAGAMAILLQAVPGLTPEDMDMILETTAVDLGTAGKDLVYGAGRLDCFAALHKAQNLHTLYGSVRGSVRDAVTGDSIPQAVITATTIPAQTVTSNSHGDYRIYGKTGPITMAVSAFGYESQQMPVTIVGAPETICNFVLNPRSRGSLTGRITAPGGEPIVGASVRVKNQPVAAASTDTAGVYSFADLPSGLLFTIEAAKFNYHVTTDTTTIQADSTDTLNLALPFGLVDNFETDQGWYRSSTDNASGGRWERGDPVATFSGTTVVQPDSDYTAVGSLCWLTENCNPGATQLFSDVDAGTTTLRSPTFDGLPYHHATLNFRRWFTNNTQGPATDALVAQVSADSGQTWVTLESTTTSNRSWLLRQFQLDLYVTVTSRMQIRFVIADLGAASVVEAAIDEVSITENTSDIAEDPESVRSALAFSLGLAAPNPYQPAVGAATAIDFRLPSGGPTRLSVYDVQGRRVVDLLKGTLAAGGHRATWDGRDADGQACGAGLYFYRLTQGTREREGRLVLLR